MGIFNDIISTLSDTSKINDIKELGNVVYDMTGKTNNASLAKRASEGTLQFPVIISSALDIETAQIVTKSLERQFATFAQVAFSLSPTLRYREGVTAVDYLKRFHQNQINMFDLVFKEGYDVLETDDYVILSGVYETSTQKITAENKEQLINMIECVNHDILNNKFKPKFDYIYNFSDDTLNQKYNNPVVKEAKELNERKYNWQQKQDNINNKRDDDRLEIERMKMINQTVDLSRDMLKNNDIQKANELIASTLHLRVKLVNKNDEDIGILDFIVGVKGVMHPVNSAEMISNMVSACRNDDKIFNFLRWTTGEISFFRDFFLNINETKKDVFDRSNGSSPWWVALKRRKSASGIMNVLNKFRPGQNSETVLPNATIVISSEEVSFIKSEFGFDLFDKIFVNKIMKKYFLLGFVIVDNATQIAHFIFDGDPEFQAVTFSALEKSGSNDERKFKEMLKTMNRL